MEGLGYRWLREQETKVKNGMAKEEITSGNQVKGKRGYKEKSHKKRDQKAKEERRLRGKMPVGKDVKGMRGKGNKMRMERGQIDKEFREYNSTVLQTR